MPVANGQLFIDLPRCRIHDVTLSATNRFQTARDKFARIALDETPQVVGLGA
jgi:hypothetical protein